MAHTDGADTTGQLLTATHGGQDSGTNKIGESSSTNAINDGNAVTVGRDKIARDEILAIRGELEELTRDYET